MKLSRSEKKTLAVYERIAKKRAVVYTAPLFYWDTQFKKFRKMLPGGKILDLGCGDGRQAPLFTMAGYAYTGIDISDAMLVLARKQSKKFRNAAFHKMSMYDLNFPTNSFDGFWATSSLVHIPKTRLRKVFKQIRRVVKDGGIGFIAMKKGSGHRTLPSVFIGDARIWFLYNKREFEDILRINGLLVLQSETFQRNDVPPFKFDTTWICYWVKVKQKDYEK